MFKEERDEYKFNWDAIGDVAAGRPNLGSTMEVSVYRLMQFTLRDAVIQEFDVKTADRLYYKAGLLAGRELCKNLLNKSNDFSIFINQLQELLSNLKIGILRVEKSDLKNMNFVFTIAEDLDCSGLPVSGETTCTYDEGFIEGVLSEYSGEKFTVQEVDCWCSGDRVCRFDIKMVK